VTVSRTSRSGPSRRRKRKVKTKYLVLLAVTACLALLIGRGSAQIVSSVQCESHPVLINVAVSTDIAPAIQRIADVFNRQHHRAGGQCVSVEISPGSPVQAEAQIDGQHPDGQGRVDAWIPDSTLWMNEARTSPIGGANIQPAGFSVAHSPLMIVAPSAAVAAKITGFGTDGWRLLLPKAAGGPAEPKLFRLDLPDPTQSAAGQEALIEINRMLGSGASARVRFARFALASEETPYFDDPVALKAFASLAAPPLDGLPVTVTSEQAVLAYDQASPHEPLAASYPSGSTDELGSPELDYPYLYTTPNPLRIAAATAFGQMLTGPYARSVIRYAGFRAGAGDGTPDQFDASFGLSKQLLQIAPPAAATAAATELQAWGTLAIASRDLALIDVSSAMNVPADPADPAGPTLEQEMSQTASLGLALFADNASLGLWAFADNLYKGLPYKPEVPIGPLTASLGIASRRDVLVGAAAKLQANGGPEVALYGSILDAYEYMQKTYQPKDVNTVVVLTSGVENAPGDISAKALIHKLSAIENSARRVVVVIIIFGKSPIYNALQTIAHTTGGQAYEITSAQDIGKVFFRAIAHRLCQLNCVSG
jgi:Bacterial extracellular solute-binding protein